MIDKQILGIAACQNDEGVENSGFEKTIRSLSVDQQGLLYVAEQRALRMILNERGQTMPDKKIGVLLTPEEQRRLSIYTAICVDGILIGVRASK